MLSQKSRKHGRGIGVDFLLGGKPPLSDLRTEQNETEKQPETQDNSFHFTNLLKSGLHCGRQGSSMGKLTWSEYEFDMVHMDSLSRWNRGLC